MKIVVDLQALQNGSRHRGIGRYCEAFFKALIRNSPQHEYVLLYSGLMSNFIDQSVHAFKKDFPFITVKVWDGLAPSSFMNEANSWRRQASEVLREEFIERLHPDLLIVGSIFEGCGDDSVISVPSRKKRSYATAAIMYDLIPYIYREEYLADPMVLAWYEERLQSLKNCDFWFAISESSRREGIDILSLPEDRIKNVSAAVDPQFQTVVYDATETEHYRAKFHISKPFVLYSGATDPRKNVERLISAFAHLEESVRKAHQLVIAGGMPESHKTKFIRLAKNIGLNDADLIITGRITDDELIYLYNSCRCFVLPSYHEGFGLPALEAMRCGAPTIGADVSSIPEVIGLAEAMFDPFSNDAIKNHLHRALLDDEFRKKLTINARTQAKKFSWDKTAIAALQFIDELLIKVMPSHIETDVMNVVEKIDNLRTFSHNKEDLAVASALIARLEPRSDPRKIIFVDVSEFARRNLATGIQRVVKNIAGVLASKTVSGYCVRFVKATESDGYRYCDSLFALEKKFLGSEGHRIDPREGDVFIGLDYHDQIIPANEEYLKFMRRRGVSIQFVLYDILPLTLSGYFSTEVRNNFERWLRVVGMSDRLICISREVAREYAEWRSQFDKNATAEITWFHLGADVTTDTGTNEIPTGQTNLHQIPEGSHSFLMVGTLEPRKGHRHVLKAFEALWARGSQAILVIAGRAGWMMDDFLVRLRTHPEIGKRLFWIENASDEVLLDLYRKTTCLIAASEGEGFGLPIIEAARHGLHLLVRDLGVFREVAGDGAAYFGSSTPAALANAIEQWLNAYVDGRAPNPARVRWITWKQSTEALLDRLSLKLRQGIENYHPKNMDTPSQTIDSNKEIRP